jgi:hypothetical protein
MKRQRDSSKSGIESTTANFYEVLSTHHTRHLLLLASLLPRPDPLAAARGGFISWRTNIALTQNKTRARAPHQSRHSPGQPRDATACSGLFLPTLPLSERTRSGGPRPTAQQLRGKPRSPGGRCWAREATRPTTQTTAIRKHVASILGKHPAENHPATSHARRSATCRGCAASQTTRRPRTSCYPPPFSAASGTTSSRLQRGPHTSLIRRSRRRLTVDALTREAAARRNAPSRGSWLVSGRQWSLRHTASMNPFSRRSMPC